MERSPGTAPSNIYKWEFVAMPWTYESDTAYTLDDGWEPVGVVPVEMVLHLLCRRRVKIEVPNFTTVLPPVETDGDNDQ